MINKYLLVLILILVSILIFQYFSKEHFQEEEKLPERPFANLFDDKGNHINVLLLSRPFWLKEHYNKYNELKDKYLMLGVSSYQAFPGEPANPGDNYNKNNPYEKQKWLDMCKGWLHCFRNPDDHLPKDYPKILMSESDFADCLVNKPNPSIEKKFDFIYICHRDDLSDCSPNEWVAYNKNLTLAEKCLTKLCKEKDFKGLLIGREGCALPPSCNNLKVELTKKLDYYELQKKFDECRFIFIPNINDASPRVITESLCHNIPCLVNQNIIGGWKYINDKTGVFFNDENDFIEKFDEIREGIKNNKYEPRKYFVENYGIINSGKKLKDFIYKVFGDKVNIPENQVKYINPEFRKKDFSDCLV